MLKQLFSILHFLVMLLSLIATCENVAVLAVVKTDYGWRLQIFFQARDKDFSFQDLGFEIETGKFR